MLQLRQVVPQGNDMSLRSRFPHVLFAIAILVGLCVGQSRSPTSPINNKNAERAMVPGGHPECPGIGSCCVGHGNPGCNNSNCCNIVCDFDYFCCIGWDMECASLAESMCLSMCAGSCPGEGDCCEAHSGGGCRGLICCDLVCLNMPACCETGWTAACVALASQICDGCDSTPKYNCPQPGDCCTGRSFSAGCERAACCQTVCALDPICCTTEWDDTCAHEADQHCHHVCDCESFGDFDANQVIDLRDAAAFQSCFSGDGSAPIPAICACADFDGDGDADLEEFGIFANRYGNMMQDSQGSK